MTGYVHLPAILVVAFLCAASLARAAGMPPAGGTVNLPSARLEEAGTFGVGFFAEGSRRSLHLSATPLPWAELTVRRSVLPGISAEDAADLKLRLIPEGPDMPQVVVGRRALAGDGDAGSYLALSRRFRDLDLTLGLGTGDLADRHGFDLPFGSSRASPFAGLAWDLPGAPLTALAGYDPGSRTGGPLDLGLRWRVTDGLDLSVGWSRGERATAGISWRFTARPTSASISVPVADHEQQAGAIAKSAEAPAAGNLPVTIRLAPPVATIWLDELEGMPAATAAGRAARALAQATPPSIERLDVVLQPDRLDGTMVSLTRSGLDRAGRNHGSPAELWLAGKVGPVGEDPPEWPDRLSLVLSPLVEIDPGDTTGALSGRAALDIEAAWRQGGWLTVGTLRLNRAFGMAMDDGAPSIPGQADPDDYARVPLAVARAYGAWLGSPGAGWHLRYAGGLLDEMHAGTSLEALYRPVGRRWAAGAALDLPLERVPGTALVRPEPLLAWSAAIHRDDPDGNGSLSLQAGRYLGGDHGATLSLKREIGHGLKLRAHATWTDGTDGRPYSGYGLDLVLPLHRPAGLPLTLRPELRLRSQDGGGRSLDQPLPLHDLTTPASYGAVAGSWDRLLD